MACAAYVLAINEKRKAVLKACDLFIISLFQQLRDACLEPKVKPNRDLFHLIVMQHRKVNRMTRAVTRFVEELGKLGVQLDDLINEVDDMEETLRKKKAKKSGTDEELGTMA